MPGRPIPPREKPNNVVAAATRRRHGVITWSHNAEALRLDAVLSDHDPPGCLARDHDARGSGKRGALALAKDVRLRSVETGFQSKRLVHQGDERPARSERAGLGQGPEGKPIEDDRTAARNRGRALNVFVTVHASCRGRLLPADKEMRSGV